MYASIPPLRPSVAHLFAIFFAVRLVAYVYLPCSAGTTTISTKVQSCLTRGLLSRHIRIDFPTCREGESRSLLSNCGLQPRYELALIGQDMLWITKGCVRISSDAHYYVNSFIRKMSLLPGRKDLLHRWTDLPFAGFSWRCREPKRSMLFLFWLYFLSFISFTPLFSETKERQPSMSRRDDESPQCSSCGEIWGTANLQIRPGIR